MLYCTDDDGDVDIYIMMKCLSVTKNHHFLVFHGFWLVSMVFQGGFMVFHGFWLVSMVF